MFKIEIKNVASQEITHGNGGSHSSLQEAQDWLAKQLAKNPCPFGKPEHEAETTPAVYDEQGVEIAPAVMETVPSEFEVIGPTDITAELATEAAKQTRIEAGKAARETCLKVLDMVAGFNLERSLTIEQITSMATTLAQPMQALQAGRPAMAKLLIAGIEADEVVTQEMIDEALELLSNY